MTSFHYKPVLFSVQEKILLLSGLWVPTYKSKKKSFFLAYIYFLMVYLQLYSVSEYFIFPYIYQDMDILVEHIGMVVQHLVGTIKIVNHFWHLKMIQSILYRLESNEFKYEPLGDFKPAEIMAKYVKLTKYFAIVWFFAGNSVPLSKIVPAMVGFFDSQEFVNGTEDCLNLMPYYNRFPFRTDTLLTCRIAYFVQLYPMVVYAWQISTCDTMFLSTVFVTTAHFRILQGAFRTIRTRCLLKLKIKNDKDILHDEDVPHLNDEMIKEINKDIKYLQKLLKLTEDIEETFNIIVLVQSLISLFVLVSCLYMVSSVDLISKAMFGNGIYLTAAVVQLSFFCVCGNEITSTCMGIKQSIYESDWYATSKSFKSNLLFTMLRMDKPVYITIGKFAPLTLDTLVGVLKGAYSFFAFLKNSAE